MKTDDFNKIVEARLKDCRATLIKKADEYARGDRLSNFKVAAAFDETTPETALWGMLLKHLVSMRDFVHDLENGFCMPWSAWEEKIRDTINYAILLEGLIQERLFPQQKDPAEKYNQITEYWKERIHGSDNTPSDMNGDKG